MYKYTDFDRQFVRARAAQFRDQLDRHFAGQLDGDDFKALRLQNGWYIQRHAPMLRVAVPYGAIGSSQIRALAEISRVHDRGYVHFTTRQNVQYNWIPLSQAADVMDKLAAVDMHGIQTSGNCIRNITTDGLAGVAADELVDPRPYAEVLRQWSTLHPEFAFLPRKFKIAISGAAEDRAAIGWHDVGLQLVKNEAGEIGFKVLVGGGMGRTPIIGSVIREFLPWNQILVYLEAVVRVYNRYGRRDNAYKARIKILVKAEGQKYFDQVEAEFRQILENDPDGALHLIPQAELDRVAACFTRPAGVEPLPEPAAAPPTPEPAPEPPPEAQRDGVDASGPRRLSLRFRWDGEGKRSCGGEASPPGRAAATAAPTARSGERPPARDTRLSSLLRRMKWRRLTSGQTPCPISQRLTSW